jgi:peptide/nickel transport system ATP-binding protein
MSAEAGTPLLDLQDVSKTFVRASLFGALERTSALEGVSLWVEPGGCVGVVGESGSGKSTLARCILGLERPDSGRIFFQGHRIDGRRRGKADRGQIQPVFQNPTSSLNPRRKIEAIIGEPLAVHTRMTAPERRDEVVRLLDLVALPREVVQRYPGQLSGGQCQRVSIARALALRPKLIVADEATSALDVLIQGQIIELLRRLRREFGIAILFVSHNLAVTRLLCDQIAVMRQGRVVEFGRAEQVIGSPTHPYTQTLIRSVPSMTERKLYQAPADLAPP